MTKHIKAFRCRISDTGRIYRLKENWNIPINMSNKPKTVVDHILEKYPYENIIIKSEESAPPTIVHGIKVKSHIRGGGRNPPLKNTTKWLYLIKSDGTVRTVIDKRYVGEKVR